MDKEKKTDIYEPTYTQADTEKAGYPCSDSKGSSAPDVAPVKKEV